MKLPSIVRLLVAFGASYLLAGFIVPDHTVGSSVPVAPKSGIPPMKPAKSGPPRIGPRDLLAAIDSTPMSGSERFDLRSELYDQWAESDPLGMLASFNGRAIPGNVSLSRAFAVLAATRPAELLRYAREQGCDDAVKALLSHGDPRANLSLLLESTSYSYPAGIYESLFKEGEELDPDFHRRIAGLPDTAAKESAFAAAAKVMLESKRYDDYFTFLSENPDLAKLNQTAEDLAEIVAADPSRLEQFDQLPEKTRSWAVEQMVTRLSDLEDSGQAARALLPEYARRGWLDERRDEVMEAIMSGAQDEDGNPSAPRDPAWKDWAFSLPEGETWDYLRELGIARWATGELGNDAAFDQLPDSRLQDAARIGAIMGFISQHEMDEAAQAAGKIHGSKRRDLYLRVVQSLRENGPLGGDIEDFDPFGPDEEE